MIQASIHQENRDLVFDELAKLDATIRANTMTGLRRGMQLAISLVQRDYLSGPRPARLDAITGNLRNSITSIVEINGNTITATLGSDRPYAAFHEYGFHGIEQVRGFERRIARFATRGGSFAGRDAIHDSALGSGAVYVRPHQRRVNYDGRPFIVPGLEKAMPLIMTEIEKEL
jgi:phage gpG-like protein